MIFYIYIYIYIYIRLPRVTQWRYGAGRTTLTKTATTRRDATNRLAVPSSQSADFKMPRAHERARVSRPPPAAPGSVHGSVATRGARGRGDPASSVHRDSASDVYCLDVRCENPRIHRDPRRVKSYGCGRTDGLAYGPHVHATYSGLQRLHAQRSPPGQRHGSSRPPGRSPAALRTHGPYHLRTPALYICRVQLKFRIRFLVVSTEYGRLNCPLHESTSSTRMSTHVPFGLQWAVCTTIVPRSCFFGSSSEA